MDYAEFMRMINAQLDGESQQPSRIEGENHLVNCPDCCGEVTDWQTCLDWLRKTFPEQAPPVELWEKLRGRTEQQDSR